MEMKTLDPQNQPKSDIIKVARRLTFSAKDFPEIPPQRPLSVSFATTPIVEYFHSKKPPPASQKKEARKNQLYAARKVVKHVVAAVDIGSKYFCAGFLLEYTDGSQEHHIKENWTVCRHCPQNDPRMPLSEALLEIPTGKLLAIGYEAHIRFLNSSHKQRQQLMLVKGLLTDVLGQNTERNVSDGKTVVSVNYQKFIEDVIKECRKGIFNEIQEKSGGEMGESILMSSMTWLFIADSEILKTKLEKILSQIDPPPYRIIIRSNATITYLAGLPQQTQMPGRAVSPIRKFISLHTSATSTTITYATVQDGVVFPASRKTSSFGYQTISDALYRLLQIIFGDKMVQSYKDENYEGYVDLIGGIEKAEHLIKADQDMVIHVPFSFCSHFNKKSKAKIVEHPTRMGFKFNPTDNSVVVPFNVAVQPFHEYVEKVTALLNHCLQDQPPDLNATVPIYLTGTFSENALCQQLLRSKLNGCDVLLPPEPKFAALLGALKSQTHTSQKIYQSIYTIGITAAAHCDHEALHFPVARTAIRESYFCDAFISFIRKSQYVPEVCYETKKSFFAATPTQQSIWIRIFFASEASSVMVYEDQMECVAQMHLHVPLEKRGVTTGKLFVFEVVVRLENGPPGVQIIVQDADGIILGMTRIVRPVLDKA